jgi:hypothetical protein
MHDMGFFGFFKNSLETWESMFADATSFANQLPPEALISISHSADQGKRVVAVWYRSKEIN